MYSMDLCEMSKSIRVPPDKLQRPLCNVSLQMKDFTGCCRYRLGDEFARNAGYNQVGELNNIIMLYPQAISTGVNPMGCWDWWGYTVSFYGEYD